MLPHWALGPFDMAGIPTFFIHTTAPVVSSSAKTLFWVVTAMKMPLPPGPFSKYSGEAHMFPANMALNAASKTILAAAAFVSFGCRK